MYLYFDVTEILLFRKTTRIRENAGKFLQGRTGLVAPHQGRTGPVCNSELIMDSPNLLHFRIKTNVLFVISQKELWLNCCDKNTVRWLKKYGL